MLGIGRRSGGDPDFASVVLLACNESGADAGTTFDDASLSNHTLTANGTAAWDDAQAPTGQTSSLLSTGNGNFLSAADDADFDVADGLFTLEGWTRWSSVASFRTVYSKRTNFSTFANLVVLRNGTSLALFATSNGTSWDIANGSAIGTVAIDTWYSWAVTYDGATIRKFLNGAKNATDISSTAVITNGGTATVKIGAEAASQTGSQWVASVRLNKGVCRYTANYTPPDLPLLTS